MTNSDRLDLIIKTALKDDGGSYLSEEIHQKWCHSFSMHQVKQSLSRLMTKGCVIGRNGEEGQFRSYSYNYLFDGSRLINNVWRKKK